MAGGKVAPVSPLKEWAPIGPFSVHVQLEEYKHRCVPGGRCIMSNYIELIGHEFAKFSWVGGFVFFS